MAVNALTPELDCGRVEGLAYFVPNPLDQAHASMNGLFPLALSTLLLLEKKTASLLPVGRVAGFAYLVPKPLDHAHAEINGLSIPRQVTRFVPFEFHEHSFTASAGSDAGFAYLLPKPLDQA